MLILTEEMPTCPLKQEKDEKRYADRLEPLDVCHVKLDK